MIPVFDYMWDFFTGTTSDVNMSRMHAFYENNLSLQDELSENAIQGSTNFNQWAN